MPNYSLVANNVFQRRSFDELMKPLAMYAEEYNKIEDAIGELDTKASVWEGMANEERDPVAYAQYKRYADDLREQATLLANNGLNPMTRRNLLGLKSRYASEIAPIEQAYANRKAQAEEQRKALLQNPTLLLSRRADMTSLDQYLNNPELSYDSYSGALLTQQVGTAAANLAKQLRSYGNGQPLDAYTKTWLQQHGYTADEVAMAINNPNDSRSSKVLTSLVNNVIADSGIPQWADKATLNQAYNYANQGLWQAVGQMDIGTYKDTVAEKEAIASAMLNASRIQQLNSLDTVPKFDRRNVRGPKEIAAVSNNAEAWEKYKKYFRQDEHGNWYLKSAGWKENLEKTFYIGSGYDGGTLSTADTKYGQFLKSIGLYDFVKRLQKEQQKHPNFHVGSYGIPTELSNNINNLIVTSQGGLDTHADIEYTRGIDPANYKNIISILSRNATNGEIPNFIRNKGDEGWSYAKDNMVDISDLSSDNIKGAQVVYGDHGDFLEVRWKDGSTTLSPFSALSRTYSDVVKGNKDRIMHYYDLLDNGQTVLEVSPGVFYKTTDLINAELNGYGENLLSSLGLSKVETKKVTPGYYGTR